MFNTSKLMKKANTKASELEEELAKTLQHFEQSNADLKAHLRLVYVTSAEQVEHKQADGTMSKYILIRIPYRSLQSFRKVGKNIIDHLEAKFKWPVVMVANRTIVSTRAITHASQKRPRSRTLKAVHNAILDDIVSPSFVSGRQVRVSVDGKRQEKVFLDPLDREIMTDRLEALADAYKRLTTHSIVFEFSKPTAFQSKKLEQLTKKSSK